jgi:hypothetical protein
MDLSGQHRIVAEFPDESPAGVARSPRLTAGELAYVAGQRLLAGALRDLGRADVAAVDIELDGGLYIHAVRTIRIDGPVAATSSRRGVWDRSFAIDRVIGVRTRMTG